MQGLELEKNDDRIKKAIIHELRKLNRQDWSNTNFWPRVIKIEGLMQKRTSLYLQASLKYMLGIGISQSEWESCEKTRFYTNLFKAGDVQRRIYQRQCRRVEDGQNCPQVGFQTFTELFKRGQIGFGNKSSMGCMINTHQEAIFRYDLIKHYKARDDRWGYSELIWCPILGEWKAESEIVATPLFSHIHGQETMDSLFGNTGNALYSPQNGLLLSNTVHEMFHWGFLIIIPPDPREISGTETIGRDISIQSYQIRLIDPSHPLINQPIGIFGKCWKDLDGKLVQFSNPCSEVEFRPNPRYLYFHYCVQMLCLSWRQDSCRTRTELNEDISKYFWGAPGNFLPRNMLLSLVKEMGSKYKRILEGAGDDRGIGENCETLLAAVTDQITYTSLKIQK